MHSAVNICNSGRRHGVDGGAVPGEQGGHHHNLERGLCFIRWILSQSLDIYSHYVCCRDLLRSSFTLIVLQPFQQIWFPGPDLPWQGYWDRHLPRLTATVNIFAVFIIKKLACRLYIFSTTSNISWWFV